MGLFTKVWLSFFVTIFFTYFLSQVSSDHCIQEITEDTEWFFPVFANAVYLTKTLYIRPEQYHFFYPNTNTQYFQRGPNNTQYQYQFFEEALTIPNTNIHEGS